MILILTIVLVAFAAFCLIVCGAAWLRRVARYERDDVLEGNLAAKRQRLLDRLATQRLDERLRHRTAQRRARAAELRERAAEIDSGQAPAPRHHRTKPPAEIVVMRRPESAA